MAANSEETTAVGTVGSVLQTGLNDSQKFIYKPNYLMFGTYRTECTNFEINWIGIKVIEVRPNSGLRGFKFNIFIPFNEIQELMYCSDPNTSLIIVKPIKESNVKIQSLMHLGPQSPNRFKFDIDSNDSREHYIIIVFENKTTFVRNLIKLCNKRCECHPIKAPKARQLLRHSQTESSDNSSDRTEEVLNNTQQLATTKPNTYKPNYVMIGTYRTSCDNFEIYSDGIKMVSLSPNSLRPTKFRYHIRIPFIEIQELMYCSDPSISLIIVKPIKESNVMIQSGLHLGPQSPNRFKFDINSNDSREHYIIIVLENKTNFVNNLTKLCNKMCKCNPISSGMARHLLAHSQIENSESDMSFDESESDDESDSSQEIITEELLSTPVLLSADYVMFGSYRVENIKLKFTSKGLKFIDVSPNNSENLNKILKLKNQISILFTEMKEFLYCLKQKFQVIVVKTTEESNNEIKDSLNLGENSTNGLKFDINSNDTSEHYIVIGLEKKMSNVWTISRLKMSCKSENSECVCKSIKLYEALPILVRSQRRVRSANTGQTVN